MHDISHFEMRIGNLNAKVKTISRKLNVVGTTRVVWFLTFLIIFVFFINSREILYAGLAFLVFVVGFVILVVLFNRLKFDQSQVNHLILINEQEINRLGNEFKGIDPGVEFKNPQHHYVEDLDIFGKDSVFQLINRTSTIPGKNLLAARLLGNKPPEDLPAYHEAIQELSSDQEFLQNYQALGMHFDFSNDQYQSFDSWLQSEEKLSLISNKSFLLILLPALFIFGFVLTSILSITYYALLPIIAINLYLLGINHGKTSQVVEQTSSVVNLLKTYVRHIRLVRAQNFQSEVSSALQLELVGKENNDAEKAIQELSRLLDQLQARTNLLHIFINIPFILDLQWMSRLNNWKIENRDELVIWMNTLAEFEVLVSLAGTSNLNPDWCFPKTTNEDYFINCRQMGHPLILPESRVSNDFTLGGAGKSVIITGPNMAGKSTFLRTIALNIVLAKMGSPVCATQMSISNNFKVFTAMRTQDDLSENISSFYAELDRIKQLLKEIESGESVLYFLDELLKGTNSADRHKGAEALVRQLIALKVTGFVSTHDIELGELTTKLPEVSNYSFESVISNGQINFDYKIREGICSSFNATELMRQMGIQV